MPHVVGPRTLVLADVVNERERQERKFGPDRTCASPRMTNLECLAVLAEEFGEVSRAVCEREWGGKGLDELRAELIQVAAVAVAWVEGLDVEVAS